MKMQDDRHIQCAVMMRDHCGWSVCVAGVLSPSHPADQVQLDSTPYTHHMTMHTVLQLM